MPPSRARGRGRGRGRGGSARGGSAAASASGDTSTAAAAPEQIAQTSQPVATESSAPEPIPAANPSAQTVPPASSTPQPKTSQTNPTAKPSGLAGSKHKPIARRRNAADRARAEEEYERKLAESNAKEGILVPRTSRGRGRGRARGGLMRGWGRGSLSGGMSFGSSSGGGYNASTGAYAQAQHGSGGPSADGDSDGRINADELYRSVPRQEEETDSTGKYVLTGKKRPIMPMGIKRVEHKAESVTMITAAQIEALRLGKTPGVGDSGSQTKKSKGESAEAAADDGVWAHAVPKSRSQVRIKEEPVDEDAMDLDLPEGQVTTPKSPQLGKKDITGSDEKPIFIDPEEEYDAWVCRRMLELFTTREGEQTSELEGHMFLFQFPRTLAPLKATAANGSPSLVKPEADDDEELFVSNDPPATTTSIDLTTVDDSKIKKEDDKGNDDGKGEPAQIVPEAGFLGNLIVRRSGKAELSWGGRRMEVQPGITTHYLSQAVLVEEGDAKPGQVKPIAGTALGFGRIQGNFNAAYKLEEEEEWNPTEEDLEN